MNIRFAPDPIEKLALLGDVNRFEAAGDQPLKEKSPAVDVPGALACIQMVATPHGRVPILKAMVTTACEMNCYYCPFRAGRGRMERVTFKPDELAKAFDTIQRAGLVEGIFLSSGIVGGGVRTQDRIIDTAEIIRRRYGYTGYIHLKIMPGAEEDQIRRALELADRVSTNLEGPSADRLSALAPRKDFEGDLLGRLQMACTLIEERREQHPHARHNSLVTQFVVGAVGDTDLELLVLSAHLYNHNRLQRAYYSAFNPVIETPFESLPATPGIRERRLYQASFLLRDYGWDVEEMPFTQDGNLRLDIDPKRAWAEEHLRYAPIEVMTAERRDLLRIPGVGPKGADAILMARRTGKITELAHLRRIGIRAPEQAAPYILLDGHRPPHQLSLFD